MHLSFLTSHNLLFFCLCKASKNRIFGFSVAFSRKIVPISIFKVQYLENGLADFNDFGLIFRVLNGLSNGMNLFWRCSYPFSLFFSPLTSLRQWYNWFLVFLYSLNFITDFVAWIVTFYQLMLVVTGVMHEADNAYSIRSTWLCYRLVRFLITAYIC